jgi:GT2 family glycosyltransferase
MKISFIIPVFNNFHLTKHIYENLQEYFPNDEIVISDGGSTDQTIEYFKTITNSNLLFLNNGLLNLAENYNIGVKSATQDIVVLLHNDMFIPPNFKEKLLADLKLNTIVSFSRIEPPIFSGEEPGKIIKDFGTNINNINKKSIIKFSETYDKKYEGGSLLFNACYKSNYLFLDEKTFNPPQMWASDDDLNLRYILNGFKCIISDACVYHFVSQTSRKGNYKEIELNSNKNFIRKWGFRHSKYNKRYNIAYVVDKCNYDMMAALEPWCDRLYTDDEMGVLFAYYYENEQKNTSYDLKKRILTSKFNDPIGENDIIVEFDGTQLTNNSFNILQQLPDIITESGEVGTFELDIFKITIHKIESLTNNLIFISNN